MDFDKFLEELNYTADVLNNADVLEEIGFTEKQVKFINVLIKTAIEQYDKAKK